MKALLEVRSLAEKMISLAESSSEMSSDWIIDELGKIIEACDDGLQHKLPLEDIEDDEDDGA